MGKLIVKLYYLFWHDLLQRQEPFTYQFRRMAKAHPKIFWGMTGVITASALGGFAFMIWFVIHILEGL